jgi:hypothetical protein
VALLAAVTDIHAASGWGPVPVMLAVLAALGLGFLTFIRVYWRTRLWKLTHAGFKSLDERQVQIVYDALRVSYWIFAIVCVVTLYVNAVLEQGHIPVVVAAAVLYLAHTLPAAVLAWKEEEIPSDR